MMDSLPKDEVWPAVLSIPRSKVPGDESAWQCLPTLAWRAAAQGQEVSRHKAYQEGLINAASE